VLVLDNPDPETVTAANRWVARGARILPIDVRDLGAARNAAVRSLKTEWIAFLDADDLWGESWLTRAHQAATATEDPSALDVWHPQVNVMFGASQSLLHHIDSSDPSFSSARLRLHNAWTALSFVRRVHLKETPYPQNRIDEGFGYEDWSWNIEVLRRGGRHRVVGDTVHAIRRTPNNSTANLLAQSVAALRSPYPTPTPDPAPFPGATTAVSALTPTDADLPPQYRVSPVGLSKAIYDDVRTAATIEPAITHTIRSQGQPIEIAQNTNLHVTRAQQALEEVDLLLRDADSARTLGELLDASPLVVDLDVESRHRVIAETLMDPMNVHRSRGNSPLIAETLETFPQLVLPVSG